MSIKLSACVVTLVFLAACGDSPVSPPPVDPVESVASRVNADSLLLCVRQLTGETMVMIKGQPRRLVSRFRDHPDNDRAADFISAMLKRRGLEVVNHWFSTTGRNVYARQAGVRFPDQWYLIGAHYDSYSRDGLAPGADDNASGTAAVLEAARLLSEFNTDYGVIYALWDEEELGLRGSRAFADSVRRAAVTIVGVLNLDMIGWDANDDGVVALDVTKNPGAMALSDKLLQVNEDYEIGLLPYLSMSIGRSDHVAFWEQGYAAIMLIEDFGGDFNQYYHSVGDTLGNFNRLFFYRCAKLAAVSLTSLAMSE